MTLDGCRRGSAGPSQASSSAPPSEGADAVSLLPEREPGSLDAEAVDQAVVGPYLSPAASPEQESIVRSETASLMGHFSTPPADALQVASQPTDFSLLPMDTTFDLPSDSVEPVFSPRPMQYVGDPSTRSPHSHAREQLLQRWREVRTTQSTSNVSHRVSQHLRAVFGYSSVQA